VIDRDSTDYSARMNELCEDVRRLVSSGTSLSEAVDLVSGRNNLNGENRAKLLKMSEGLHSLND